MSIAYTEEDIAYIIANYKTVSYEDIAKHIECSVAGLKKKMHDLCKAGLIKLPNRGTRALPIGSERIKIGKDNVKYMKRLVAKGKWLTLYRITPGGPEPKINNRPIKGISQSLLERPFTPTIMAKEKKGENRISSGKHIKLQQQPKQLPTLKKDPAMYKMVRVDNRTQIEVHISKSDEDAINEWIKRREQSLADKGR